MLKLYPYGYYKRYYLSKANSNGVDFITKTSRTSRIRMVNELVERGIRSYYGEAIREEIRDNVEKKAHSDEIRRFIFQT